MDSSPTNDIVSRNQWLVPGTDTDAPGTTVRPFLLVYRPEGIAPLSVDIPFTATRIIVYAKRLTRRWAKRDGISRAVSGAAFTDRTKLVDTEGNWLVHLKW